METHQIKEATKKALMLRTYLYICIHVPTGRRFPRSAQYHTLMEFYNSITQWNHSNPTVWAYAPIGDE